MYWLEQWNDVAGEWELYAGARPEMITNCNVSTREDAEEWLALIRKWDQVNTEFYGMDFTTEYRIVEV
jgi:hypothetical protein